MIFNSHIFQHNNALFCKHIETIMIFGIIFTLLLRLQFQLHLAKNRNDNSTDQWLYIWTMVMYRPNDFKTYIYVQTCLEIYIILNCMPITLCKIVKCLPFSLLAQNTSY